MFNAIVQPTPVWVWSLLGPRRQRRVQNPPP